MDEGTIAKIVQVETSAEVDTIWSRLERRWSVDKETLERRPGKLLASLQNATIILREDPRWKGRLQRNLFTGMTELDGHPITDEDETGISLWIAQHYGLSHSHGPEISADRVHRAAAFLAAEHPYHPVRQYLEGLTWDRTPRIEGWLTTFLGAEDTPLHREISVRWLISCVARVLQPGCKVDTTLILVGPQGARKSSAFDTLAGPGWFCDSPLDFSSKDAMANLQGVWIYELGELDSLQRRESSTVKAFLSRREDRFRPAYGRNPIERKRETVFVGSTNEPEFLNDPTGSRRFWPVKVGGIRLAELAAARDQLWAEAVCAYRASTPWWLEGPSTLQLVESSEPFRQVDPWEDKTRDWTRNRFNGFTVAELLSEALEVPSERQHMGLVKRAAGILARQGCVKGRSRLWGRECMWFPNERAMEIAREGQQQPLTP